MVKAYWSGAVPVWRRRAGELRFGELPEARRGADGISARVGVGVRGRGRACCNLAEAARAGEALGGLTLDLTRTQTLTLTLTQALTLSCSRCFCMVAAPLALA